MKAIHNFLNESFPNNPFDVIIKNKYYPQGLREIDVYDYYIHNKDNILKWIGNRQVAFRIRVNESSSVIRRKINGKPIYLTKSNFEQIIHGRVNSIYVEQPKMTNYFVIDIDLGSNLTMKHAIETSKILMSEFHGKYELIMSSDKGLHYIGQVNKTQNINILRLKIQLLLEDKVESLNGESKIIYTVNRKNRKVNTINFDLSPMYDRSLHIAKYSLTKEFLISDDPKNGLKRVKRNKS